MPKLKDITGQPGIKGFTQPINRPGNLKLPKRAPNSPPLDSPTQKKSHTEMEPTTDNTTTNMDVGNVDDNDRLNNSQEEDGNPDPDQDKDLIPAENMTLEEKIDAILLNLNTSHRTIDQKLTGFQRSLDESLVNTMTSNNELMQLKQENAKLNSKYMKMERENKTLRNRVSLLEDKYLACNIVMNGIIEEDYERPSDRLNWVYKAIAYTVDADNYNDRLRLAKKATIVSTRRLGPIGERKIRPVSITFERRSDVEYLMRNKRYLPTGVYANREYSKETEDKRRTLRPILKAARNLKHYIGKCKMVGDHLFIAGKRYDIDNLNELPDDLNSFNVTSKSENNTLGFFGELNPFSNFHHSPFSLNGIHFNNGEQFIQYTKARHYGDLSSASKIMKSDTSFECKQIGKQISANNDPSSWEECAKEKCKPGILAKFTQNRPLLNTLLSTGNKRLVESSFDPLWGTGLPLYYDNWLQGITQTGILGEILMEIRQESFIPSSNTSDTRM